MKKQVWKVIYQDAGKVTVEGIFDSKAEAMEYYRKYADARTAKYFTEDMDVVVKEDIHGWKHEGKMVYYVKREEV